MTLLPTSACTHDCDQGDSCACHPAPRAADDTRGGVWIRIPDAVLVLLTAMSIGVVIGVQLVRAGMAA